MCVIIWGREVIRLVSNVEMGQWVAVGKKGGVEETWEEKIARG